MTAPTSLPSSGRGPVESGVRSVEAPLDLLVPLPVPVPVVAGTRYAIVADHPGTPVHDGLAFRDGATGDAYPRGIALASETDGVTWVHGGLGGGDLHVRTYVVRRA